ncbi:MAG: 3-hydroxyacyl-CoA dehydrogenase NAD-binding domain-containing protein, partial [Pseudomonadota bacterium]
MEIRRIGVIGAGQMGTGIAQVFAQADFDVLLNDVNPGAMQAALERIEKGYGRLIKRGKLEEAAAASAMQRIATTTAVEEIAQTDVVIEAATENEAVKLKIFEALRPHLAAHTILTS